MRSKEVSIDRDDLKLLMSLLPDWTKIVPPSLDPTFYGTGTYDEDLKIKNRVDKIREILDGTNK